jgi:tripartite-type tricarboxylate transporter receptor subunit TctC
LRGLFAEQGAEPMVLGPDELKTFISSEIAKWAGIIRKIGIEPM